MNSACLFSLSGVRYRNLLSIEQVRIAEGSVTAVVGPSGSGKTTFLKLLNRMVTPDSGTILYRGEHLDGIDPVVLRRKVVMLSQTPVVFPGSVRDNLLIGCRFAGLPQPTDSDLESILRETGLDKELDADAGRLSGGEKQRLALGRVLLMDPEALLLDEPSSSLDEDAERAVFDLVTYRCRQAGRTLVVVTHSARAFTSLADDVLTVVGGRVVRGDRSECSGRNSGNPVA